MCRNLRYPKVHHATERKRLCREVLWQYLQALGRLFLPRRGFLGRLLFLQKHCKRQATEECRRSGERAFRILRRRSKAGETPKAGSLEPSYLVHLRVLRSKSRIIPFRGEASGKATLHEWNWRLLKASRSDRCRCRSRLLVATRIARHECNRRRNTWLHRHL